MVNGDGSGLGGIIAAFVAVIIGLTLFISIVDTTATLTGTFAGENPTTSLINGTPVVFITAGFNATSINGVVNASGTICNETTDWIGDLPAGTINLTGTPACDTGTYNVTFSSRTNDFIDDSAARSITNLIPLFFAIAIMAGALIFIDFRRFGFG